MNKIKNQCHVQYKVIASFQNKDTAGELNGKRSTIAKKDIVINCHKNLHWRIVKEQLNKLADDFEKEYGTLLLLKANLVVINKMLIKRGREKELYDLFKETLDNLKEKKDRIIDIKE